MLTYAEAYNGLGYWENGQKISTYVYNGTNLNTVGKYTGDNNYDANTVDKQAGVYLILKVLMGF